MDRRVNVLDLFSGIGGFSLGLQKAGFKIRKHYFSEIYSHATANYQYNFPDAIHLGDIKNIKKNQIEKIDIITFGSPCQDFSMAGNRTGLKGNKSSLITEAMRVVRELQPSIFIWENVKGTFSSNARQDFWAILQAFTNLGNYRLEWQLLNTKWILPQNRERIYLIGYLAGKCEPGVFPITENDILFRSSEKLNERQPQAKICSTINPKFGSRATDTYIKVADYRYDEGLRERKDLISPCLVRGKHKSSLSGRPYLLIKNGTKKGYKIAEQGDSINFSFHTSNTRRGRVGKKCAQTLDTSCSQGVISGINQIRRFTEIECERLQGFPDDWTKFGNYNGEIKAIAKTQRYHLIGNAITVDLMELIGNKILENNG